MKNITVPELGESIIEGTLTSWLIKEGDSFAVSYTHLRAHETG